MEITYTSDTSFALVGTFTETEYVDWDPDLEMSLAEFLDYLHKQSLEVPEEYRGTTRVLVRDGEYGGCGLEYDRPETDDERKKRVLNQEDNEARDKAWELLTLARLKEKYEG